ncbi:MAG: HAMP domain-containing protein [Blastocatellia bacterium]|nr:HAMP domain-containing protein [Chloracidobacterium sp.]MBL8183591.1 HAMP domain-containing protein [Blastocatellia bacterium]HBE84122.1 two-component sensor histidine kinase [Blastocatellia bacterium]HRJ87187.1 ATP-binding protein [Pyrinomonadaceae bacterium]HRK49544.1 ATP-binding protein [Pyrinomonadaceae bacterium]
MNLFVKIFLWFLAALALMVGVMLLLNWTVQTEPVVSRWRISVRNQTNIYAATAAQIHANQGESGLNEFLSRIREAETIGEVDLIGENGKLYLSEGVNAENYRDLIARSLASNAVEFELNQPETALTARQLRFANGDRYVLIVRWERPRITPFFGESPLRYLRYAALLLTALLLCWALARYMSKPIEKLRKATQRLAGGELSARVAGEVGKRGDEISALAKDFDVMAERIESLITSQKRLSRDISHELRSPLARMNVALEIAKQKSNAETAPNLERIETESNRLNEMISRLLTLSKLETGSQDFEKSELNLKKLVEQVAADADFEAAAKGRSVRIIRADECRMRGGETLVQSAIENVLRNAVRYTKENTTVEVTLRAENGKAVVTVRDHGGGVPEDELANLFRPFYRVSEARDRGSGGIGLGLAIAEQAVRVHKGTIKARNTDGGLEVEISFDRHI